MGYSKNTTVAVHNLKRSLEVHSIMSLFCLLFGDGKERGKRPDESFQLIGPFLSNISGSNGSK